MSGKTLIVPMATVPHSWRIKDWPAAVYPGNAKTGKHVAMSNAKALIECGGLVRVGRELVVVGRPYCDWMARQGDRVLGYEIRPNAPEHIHKKRGAPVSRTQAVGAGGRS